MLLLLLSMDRFFFPYHSSGRAWKHPLLSRTHARTSAHVRLFFSSFFFFYMCAVISIHHTRVCWLVICTQLRSFIHPFKVTAARRPHLCTYARRRSSSTYQPIRFVLSHLIPYQVSNLSSLTHSAYTHNIAAAPGPHVHTRIPSVSFFPSLIDVSSDGNNTRLHALHYR